MYKVFVRSKRMYENLMKYGPYTSADWHVPEEIVKSADKIQREFLKAFFEDEGTVLRREIRLYSINKKGLVEIQQLLKGFQIQSSIVKGFGERRNVFGLVIRKKEERQKFASSIGFLSAKKNNKMHHFHAGQRRAHRDIIAV